MSDVLMTSLLGKMAAPTTLFRHFQTSNFKQLDHISTGNCYVFFFFFGGGKEKEERGRNRGGELRGVSLFGDPFNAQ